MVRSVVKFERRNRAENADEENTNGSQQDDVTERRVLRSKYLAVKNLINDERDGISGVDSDKFNSIINKVESLHQQVQKPREQVTDAEALLDITNTLVSCVKAHGNEGVTPADFVNCLLKDFRRLGAASSTAEDGRNSISWKDIGLAFSHVFCRAPGVFTMLGPMKNEPKQRKVAVYRKRVKPTESSRPEELQGQREKSTDTDKNMATMFGILKEKRIGLENLVLNKSSFAQTVENIFALSFLAKDARAEITLNEEGRHIVSTRNAPASSTVVSGETPYHHFVLRFDYGDWKLMMDSVGDGEALMPHRNQENKPNHSQSDTVVEGGARVKGPSTPIRKLSRNHGRVVLEQSVMEDSPESHDSPASAAAPWSWNGKHKRRN